MRPTIVFLSAHAPVRRCGHLAVKREFQRPKLRQRGAVESREDRGLVDVPLLCTSIETTWPDCAPAALSWPIRLFAAVS